MLGFWSALRWPERGPQHLASSLCTILLAMAAVLVTAPLVQLVIGSCGEYGPALALLSVVLPTLTFVFWAAACMIRAVASLGSVR